MSPKSQRFPGRHPPNSASISAEILRIRCDADRAGTASGAEGGDHLLEVPAMDHILHQVEVVPLYLADHRFFPVIRTEDPAVKVLQLDVLARPDVGIGVGEDATQALYRRDGVAVPAGKRRLR